MTVEITKRSTQDEVQLLNERWPEFIQDRLDAPIYKWKFNDEGVKFLKGLKFVEGKWLQNGHRKYFPRMQLTVSFQKELFVIEGFLPEEKSDDWPQFVLNNDYRGSFGGDVFLPLGTPYLQSRKEGVAFASLLDDFGLREFLMTVDGDRWPTAYNGREELAMEEEARKRGEELLVKEMNEVWPKVLEKGLVTFEYLVGFGEEVMTLLEEMKIKGVHLLQSREMDEGTGIELTVEVDGKDYALNGVVDTRTDGSDHNGYLHFIESETGKIIGLGQEATMISELWLGTGMVPKIERLEMQSWLRRLGE